MFAVIQLNPLAMADVRGVYAAAITPRGKNGEVDFGAAFELVDFLSRGGADGIALFTAAGEYPGVPPAERSRLVYLAVKRSRVPVLVGVGSATLEDSVSLAREARDAGAQALLLPPPWFFRYGQDDLCEFYRQFAAQLGRGAVTLLSNHPAYASSIEAETARALLCAGGFAGIEDSSGDRAIFSCMQAAAGPDAIVLSGCDALFTHAMRGGAQGAVSGAAGAIPETVTALARAIREGNQAEVERLEPRMLEFLAWCDEFPQPVILRTAAAVRGIKTGSLAVPLSPASARRLEDFRVWFRDWLS